jgi:hypothetical protein
VSYFMPITAAWLGAAPRLEERRVRRATQDLSPGLADQVQRLHQPPRHGRLPILAVPGL